MAEKADWTEHLLRDVAQTPAVPDGDFMARLMADAVAARPVASAFGMGEKPVAGGVAGIRAGAATAGSEPASPQMVRREPAHPAPTYQKSIYQERAHPELAHPPTPRPNFLRAIRDKASAWRWAWLWPSGGLVAGLACGIWLGISPQSVIAPYLYSADLAVEPYQILDVYAALEEIE